MSIPSELNTFDSPGALVTPKLALDGQGNPVIVATVYSKRERRVVETRQFADQASYEEFAVGASVQHRPRWYDGLFRVFRSQRR